MATVVGVIVRLMGLSQALVGGTLAGIIGAPDEDGLALMSKGGIPLLAVNIIENYFKYINRAKGTIIKYLITR